LGDKKERPIKAARGFIAPFYMAPLYIRSLKKIYDVRKGKKTSKQTTNN
jgi:hypothetical protein